MNVLHPSLSLRKIAIVAGIGYIIIFITGIFANFFVMERLVNLDHADMTFTNIQGNMRQFTSGILFFVVMVVFDFILAWALYHIFETIHPKWSAIAAILRLINALIFAIALVYLFEVWQLVVDNGEPSSISVKIIDQFKSFNETWLFGLLFFAAHLLVLSLLVWRSTRIPKWLGGLLLLAGVGYLVDSIAQYFLPNYQDYQAIFSMVVILPGVIGELALTIWLLAKGGRPAEILTVSSDL